MSLNDGVTSEAVPSSEPSTTTSGFEWVDPGDKVEVLWTDANGKPYLAKGVFVGLRIPEGDDGGPSDLVVDTGPEETAVHTEDVVGITPAPSVSTS